MEAALQLDEFLSRARAAHPAIALDERAFTAHLAGCMRGAAALHVEDLYVAFAAGRGDRAALAFVDGRLLSQVGRYVAHLGTDPAFVDEVRQQLRERMLLGGGGGAPKILEYSGRGPLSSFMRVAAVRQALDLIDREKRHRPGRDELDDDALAATADPELIAIRERHLPQFRAAFRAALDSLDVRERNLLRFYLVDGLNIGRIGEIFGKSRATVGRMVIDCRQKLLEQTRQNLGALIGGSENDLRSLMRLLQSQLDVSIRGFLQRGS